MPLTFRDRGTSGTQLDICSHKAIVGFLWKAVLSVSASRQAQWHWTWHAGPASGPEQHGTAETIDEAKAQIEDQWRAWLAAAGLRE
jgi:hypothetical protein